MNRKLLIACVGCLYLFFISCQSKKLTKLDFDCFDGEKLQNCGFGLLFFFSVHSCPPCMDVTETLNQMAEGIPIIGVLDRLDTEEIEEVKSRYAFQIELMSEQFLFCKPLLTPSLVAIDKNGRILMTLPGLPDQEKYIKQILWELSSKAIAL